MLNQVVIVGRLLDKPAKEGDHSVSITLVIPRSYKNEEGIYENDVIPAILWDGIATNAEEYLNKGDLVGVKGRLENKNNKIVVVAEKITFLSSKKEEEE